MCHTDVTGTMVFNRRTFFSDINLKGLVLKPKEFNAAVQNSHADTMLDLSVF